jgi:hypothetical protein
MPRCSKIIEACRKARIQGIAYVWKDSPEAFSLGWDSAKKRDWDVRMMWLLKLR